MKLSIENLSFSYGASPVFSGFSLYASGSGPLAILGPSGCGKTTLLKLIGGLLEAGEGVIRARTSCGAPENGDSASAGKVSFVFQEPRLLPWYTVLENTALPLRRVFKKDAEDRAAAFLEAVKLRGRERSYPFELSGG
ncbi:MAG: ATP-binding cassette domain-containing protein, partial [Spirochaetaceae bacterium]|nr:ATP-binding cassette domain-containing protein [Spirochaetaceae bacterium]